jgi:hypothetical protein
MNKQIKSSDWLTRGYSEEELANIKEQAIKEAEAELRNNQIEEMANDLRKSEHWYFDDTDCDFELNRKKTAENLYNAGYRKQSEGEWEKRVFIVFDSEKVGYRCSSCNTTWDTSTSFCPNCGARMKGGE